MHYDSELPSNSSTAAGTCLRREQVQVSQASEEAAPQQFAPNLDGEHSPLQLIFDQTAYLSKLTPFLILPPLPHTSQK